MGANKSKFSGKMRVLITGSAGFIGKYLSRKLLDSGYKVVGMDVSPYEKKENLSSFVQGSILNPEDILRAAKGVDIIINLAAKHHDFGISRKEFFEVNVDGTRNILDCANKLGIKKFIFYSTVNVYGNQKGYSTEDTPTDTVSDYGESKLAAEKLVCDWASKDSGREAVIIRPAGVFGPNNYANMYTLIDKIYKKRFIFVGRGDNIKSVAYVENLVDATIFLLQRMKPGIEVYNYSDYPQMTIKEIVNTIAHCLSRRIPKFKVPLIPAVALTSIFDLLGKLTGYNFPITANRIKKFNTATQFKSDKIRALGFMPSVELKEGFRRMVEWYLSNGGKGKKFIATDSD